MDTAEDKTAVVDLTILGVLRDFRRGIYLGIDTTSDLSVVLTTQKGVELRSCFRE